MCDLCKLADEGKEGFILTICNNCNIPLVVSREHKPEFSETDKDIIKEMFPDHTIRWEQRRIPDHAHCHILD